MKGITIIICYTLLVYFMIKVKQKDIVSCCDSTEEQEFINLKTNKQTNKQFLLKDSLYTEEEDFSVLCLKRSCFLLSPFKPPIC